MVRDDTSPAGCTAIKPVTKVAQKEAAVKAKLVIKTKPNAKMEPDAMAKPIHKKTAPKKVASKVTLKKAPTKAKSVAKKFTSKKASIKFPLLSVLATEAGVMTKTTKNTPPKIPSQRPIP